MPTRTSPAELREAISRVLQSYTKAYETEQACDALGLPLASEGVNPWGSKAVYARSRLMGLEREELVEIARKVVDVYDAEELEEYLSGVGITGVDGEMRNLILRPTDRSHGSCSATQSTT